MQTEQYSVIFSGFHTEFYTMEYIANIWWVSAEEIYEETGIYIAGAINEGYLVDGEREQTSGRRIFTVGSIRNPIEITTREKYWDSYREVVRRVRGRLENPSMSIARNLIDYYYFEDIK